MKQPPDAPTQILEFRPGMRRLIEDAIESLILLLDEIDGDDDLEGDPMEDGADDEEETDHEPADDSGIGDMDGLIEQTGLRPVGSDCNYVE
jgi:hypothetical protein